MTQISITPSRPDHALRQLDRSAPALVTVLAASMMAAAGVVHLVMVPPHIDEWLLEGIGFAVVGWLQIGLAHRLMTRPSRLVCGVSAALNLACIALWIVSRTSGFPFGPHQRHAEIVGFIDGTTAAMEGIAVIAGLAQVARFRHGPESRASGGFAALVPLAVIALTTAALVSPSARDHASEAHGDHAADETSAAHVHADAAATAAPGAAATGTAAPSPETAAAEPHLHTNPGGAVSGGAVSGGAVSGEAVSASGSTASDDKGLSLIMNGHQHEHEVIPMDSATTALLARQLARTAELVTLYPTVADAEAAGYRRQGPYSPGLGTHYGKGGETLVGATITEDNVLDPMLIFDGTDPTSKLAGFMYIAFGVTGVPEGFAGQNDIWHYHTNICLVVNPDGSTDAPLGADRDNVPKELCDKYGGFLIENSGYMLHVWTVPGYESSKGVFNEVNPALACADGTYFTKPIEELGTSLSLCAT